MTTCIDLDFFSGTLFHQMFCDINTHRTGTERNTAKKDGKFTV